MNRSENTFYGSVIVIMIILAIFAFLLAKSIKGSETPSPDHYCKSPQDLQIDTPCTYSKDFFYH